MSRLRSALASATLALLHCQSTETPPASASSPVDASTAMVLDASLPDVDPRVVQPADG